MRHADKTHCVRGHALSGDNLRVVWADSAHTRRQRKCAECLRIRNRRREIIYVEKRVLIQSDEEKTLRSRVGELTEENRQLRELLRPEGMFPLMNLTKRERELATVIYRNAGQITSRNRVEMIFADADVAARELSKVFMCKLRKKLKLYDVAIQTVWGEGYLMKIEDAAKLKPYE